MRAGIGKGKERERGERPIDISSNSNNIYHNPGVLSRFAEFLDDVSRGTFFLVCGVNGDGDGDDEARRTEFKI